MFHTKWGNPVENITEEQQIEQIKTWWKEYGFSILCGIVIAVVIGFGWHFYQRYATKKAETASLLYERMMIGDDSHQFADAEQQANELISHYSGTPYGKLAALYLAKQAVTKNKLSDAITQLRWVIQHDDNSAFEQIAKIRLVRIYLLQKKPELALSILHSISNKAFSSLVYERRGDAYLQLGKTKKAREFYQKALNILPKTVNIRSFVEMKLNNLSVS